MIAWYRRWRARQTLLKNNLCPDHDILMDRIPNTRFYACEQCLKERRNKREERIQAARRTLNLID